MEKLTTLITGGAGVLGTNLGKSFRSLGEHVGLHLSDVRIAPLAVRGEQLDAYKCSYTNIFSENGSDSDEIIHSDAIVHVLNAAENADEMSNEKRLPSRIKQTAYFERHVDALLNTQEGSTRRRLLIVINSIASIFGDENDFAREQAIERNWQYAMMKREQLHIVRNRRAELENAGIDCVALCPGSFYSHFTNAEKALSNANLFGKKVRNYRGRKNLKQERILLPREITDPVAQLAEQWHETQVIPKHVQEWIILNSRDLILDEEKFQQALDIREQ